MSILQALFHREVSILTSGGTKLEPGNGYVYHVFTNEQNTENFQIIKAPQNQLTFDLQQKVQL